MGEQGGEDEAEDAPLWCVNVCDDADEYLCLIGIKLQEIWRHSLLDVIRAIGPVNSDLIVV